MNADIDTRLRTNSVVQIKDTHPAPEYHGLLGIVKDVLGWGCIVHVYLDNEWGLVGVQNENFAYIGFAYLGFNDEVEKCKCDTYKIRPVEREESRVYCGTCNLLV